MASDLVKSGKQLARKGILVQALLLLVTTLLVLVLNGIHSAILILIGGSIGITTNSVFAFFAFRYSGASKNHQVVQSFKKGNKAKLLLTVLLLFFVFQWPELQRVELLVGYVIVLLAHFPVMTILHQWQQRG